MRRTGKPSNPTGGDLPGCAERVGLPIRSVRRGVWADRFGRVVIHARSVRQIGSSPMGCGDLGQVWLMTKVGDHGRSHCSHHARTVLLPTLPATESSGSRVLDEGTARLAVEPGSSGPNPLESFPPEQRSKPWSCPKRRGPVLPAAPFMDQATSTG